MSPSTGSKFSSLIEQEIFIEPLLSAKDEQLSFALREVTAQLSLEGIFAGHWQYCCPWWAAAAPCLAPR